MLPPLRGLPARIRHEAGQTFRSFKHRNYLIYSIGQLVSMTGTWMQTVALMWLTYDMTHSAWLLGVVGLFTNAPVLLLSLIAGKVADKFDRRKVIIITQWIELAQAAVLAGLVLTGSLSVWMILALSAMAGIANAFEAPARQALVPDLVRGDDLINAIGINSIIFNSTRMVGPAIGAILLATVGAGICFALNALSFVAAIATLKMLSLEPKPISGTAEAKRQPSIKDGLRVAFGNDIMRNILVLTLFTSFFGFQISVLLPVFVKEVFHSTPASLGLLTAASAIGSLFASLVLASRGKQSVLHRSLRISSLAVPVMLFAFSLSHSLWLSTAIQVFVGLAISVQFNCNNSLLQLTVPNEYRGRVMSIYSMIMLGVLPFGSLAIGHVADLFGAPLAVAVCSVACALAGLFYVTRRHEVAATV
jgi:MFS family permease